MSSEIDFTWATEDNHPVSAYPWSGLPNKIQPVLARQETGYTPTEKPSAEELNYILHRVTRNAKIIEAARVFSPDDFRPMAGFPAGVTDMIRMPSNREFWALTPTNVYRSNNGLIYDYAVGAHGQANAAGIAFKESATQGFCIVGSDATPRGTNVSADPAGAISFVDMVTTGHAETLNDICYHIGGANPIVVVGENGKIDLYQASPGAGSVTNVDIGTEDLKVVASGGGRLVAVFQTSGTDGLVISDDHGSTWNNVSVDDISTSGTGSYQICYVESPLTSVPTWIAVGKGKVYTSIDGGDNWIDRTTEYQLFTREGTTETTPDFRAEKNSIATDGRYIYALSDHLTSNRGMIWSLDGINWFESGIRAPGSTSALHGMTYQCGRGGGHVVFIQASGVAFRTPDLRFTGATPILAG